MSSAIHAPRFKRFLDKYFSLKGGSGGTFLDDIMPTVQVEGPEALEGLLLRAVVLGMASATSGASAGNFSWVALVNPLASGFIASVRAVMPTSGTGPFTAFLTTFGAGAFTPLTTQGVGMDARLSRPGTAVANTCLGLVTGVQGVSPSGQQFIGVKNVVATLDAVLAPGSALQVFNGTVNEAGTIAFQWRERAAEVTELVNVGSVA